MTDMKWRDAIDEVLSKANEPLSTKEITTRIIEAGLRKNLGATPAATVGAQISASIKHDGTNSPYTRVSKGTFALKSAVASPQVVQPSSIVDTPETEEQYEIFSSFGMYWRRNLIQWTRSPKLLGRQEIDSTPVNFYDQLGIYLLYDGREVIYVGRSTDRPIGRRLFEHTADRLSTRWDRFSWFGLKPVTENGSLQSMPPTYNSSFMIPALEAVLVEALEPRQNRKRGDDLSAVEYMQAEDPQLRKKQLKSSLEEVLEKMT